MNNQDSNKPSTLIFNGSTKSRKIALTYDCDDLEYIYVSEILDTLKRHDIKATFFISGLWTEKFPELARRIASEKHQIGNHSYQHPDLTKMPCNEIKESIIKAEETIKKITGINPRPFFRPPYGCQNELVLRAVGEVGYIYTIYWSINTRDWLQPPTRLIVERIFKNVKNGDIILMHGHGKNTSSATDFTVETFKTFGCKFVKVSDILN